MPRTKTQPGRIIKKAREFTSQARSGARRALGLKPKPIAIYSIEGHLRDPQAMEALLTISDSMLDDHRERVMQDLEKDGLSPLTRYVIYMAFLETVSQPVRPLALHPQLAFWLLALPDEPDCYYPADPCWECGYRYPSTSDVAQAVRFRGLPKTHAAPPPLPVSARAPSPRPEASPRPPLPASPRPRLTPGPAADASTAEAKSSTILSGSAPTPSGRFPISRSRPIDASSNRLRTRAPPRPLNPISKRTLNGSPKHPDTPPWTL